MPLRLDIQRKFSNKSERVKEVDFHPTEPWLLTAEYNGNLNIWNYETNSLVKTFEVCDLPLRAAKFIARKSWVVTGSDDFHVKVYNYNTHEKITSFEAHFDFIRSIAVHHTLPLLLTASDDLLIKLWDWEKGWKNIRTFEGHSHYVMQVVFNPKDSNTFASASMDRTVKVWNLGSPVANYTLEGHKKGVNCVDYYDGADKPYLVSGADDKLIKVWDYQNKTCVQTLEGHTHNVIRVCYHPSLPIIVTGSEDGTIRMWHSNTYRLENTLNYGMEKVWCMACLKGSNDMAFGYDDGTVTIKLGKEEPSVSMDSSGKIIWAKQNEIKLANIQQLEDHVFVDGEKIVLPVKELGSCEIFPQSLKHSPNGRFVVVCGDGEYIIYTALAWRNKSFGQALECVWANDSNQYAIRESTSKIKLYKSFKEVTSVSIRPSYAAEGIFGGSLLGVKSSSFVVFYDWETGAVARRIDVACNNVRNYVTITTNEGFYILKFNRATFQNLAETQAAGDEGYEEAFEFITEVSENVVTGTWVGDCFVYTNANNRLNYLVGGQPSTISHFDSPVYIIGYAAKDSRVFLCDKHMNFMSYSLPVSLIEYQTAVLRGDSAAAQQLLPSIPKEHRNKLARFLEAQGLKSDALAISTDPEHRFELAMQLQELEIAYHIATELDHEHKWKSLGDFALSQWNFGLALEAWKKASDLESVMLIYQTSGNEAGLKELAQTAESKGETNIAFSCYLLVGDVKSCLRLLVNTNRIPEAAFFARTYCPSKVTEVVSKWKATLEQQGKKKAAEALADPKAYPNLFPDYEYGVQTERTSSSTSMDRTVKVWNLGSPVANYTLEGHKKGVNCVDYYDGADKPYLVSGADDKLIKVWDYQNKTCVQTLEGHTHNVIRVCYHPSLPIIVTGSEDGTIRMWHSNTYRLENTLNYGMEKVWCMACLKGSNDMAFGYDDGTVTIKLGKEEPSVSMDSSGKIIWAKQNEIKLANIQQLEDHVFVDGEKIVLPVKELGSCEIFPQSLKHSPNGRFVVVCGDGEYIIYTALAWRNKSFGQALECVWANDSNQYAIRESTSKIKLYKSFKEVTSVSIRPSYAAEGIFGGSLLGVKSSSFVVFYDWETGAVARRIDVACNNVRNYVTITTNEGFYILKFNRATFQNLAETQAAGDEGYEEAFEFITEVSENVVTGTWVGDCFVYTNANNRLNYLVGGQPSTISHFDSPVYIIGYAAKDSRVFLCDKHMNFMSYSLPVSLIEYQTAVLRGDSAAAQQLLPSIPKEHRNKLARFLEAQGLKSDALAISTDPEHRFELAMQLQELEIAYHIATELDHEHKWKSLGDFALSQWNFGLALEAWKKASDLESVMLIYQTSGNEAGLKELAQTAVNTNRIPEAAFFARTYCPSKVTEVVSKWKATLEQQGKKKAAEALADPKAYPNLFPDYEYGVQVEQILENKRLNGLPPAVSYLNQVVFDNIDLVSEVKNGQNLEELFGKVSLSPSRVASPIRPPSPVKQTKPEGKPIVNQHLRPKGIEMEEELISDNNSHLSLEVNTTGTGSIRGEVSDFADFEDTANGKVIDEIDDAELDAMLA
ncbi:Coatomer subunit beta' [Boothiomyces macroporosus]|uniref:Beta'-coat protein n=1 Tax=Boothiomyces macroporosus TaxID=261099 RepID=A0AAD5UCI9_9FUNG|nr:Coatomer subunit beta' [Boothiomyces macroporosus]